MLKKIIGMKKCKKFISIAFVFIALFVFVGCDSDDDVPTTGIVRVEFWNWKNSSNKKGYAYVYLAEQKAWNKDICVKKQEIGGSKTTDIELNPGNYYVEIDMDYAKTEGAGYLQVQAGKTEVIKIDASR